MDKFVIKEEKQNVENTSEGTHTNKNNRSISSEGRRVLDFQHQLSVCPATHLKVFRQKETPMLRSNHP